MSSANWAVLADRGVVSVTGEDAGKLLGDLVTNEIEGLAASTAVFSGLLSPQGKILFDFLIVRVGNGFLLDVAGEKAGDLVKRLAMYRLRAKVDLADVSQTHRVLAEIGNAGAAEAGSVYQDPRHAQLGRRWIAGTDDVPGGTDTGAGAAAYHAHRIALGVPEGGKDYDFADAFPHEANFDLVHGVAFDKGCYVGQEIVARMEHRGTVRKRIARVSAAADLPSSRPDVMMGDVVIGRLGSVAGRQGLAMLRLDRVIEATDKQVPVTAAGIALDVDEEMVARQRLMHAQKAANP